MAAPSVLGRGALVRRRSRFDLERLFSRVAPTAVMALTLIAVGYVVREVPMGQLEKACMAIIGAAVVIGLSSRPGIVVAVAIAGGPFIFFVQPLLHRAGLGPGMVRAVSYWKELIVVALILAVWRNRDRITGWDLDLIDWAAIVMLVVMVFYFTFPHQFPPAGNLAPTDARLLAFRNLAVIPIGIFFGRRLNPEEVWLRRGLTALMVGGAIFGTFSVWEVVNTSGFETFIKETLDLDGLDRTLFGFTPRKIIETNVDGVLVHRAGSLFRLPNQAAFFFIIPFAVSLERVAREGFNLWRGVALALAASGLILTQTRSAILGGLAVVLLMTRPGSGLATGIRVRFAIGVALVALAAAPFIAGSSLADRFAGAITSSDRSSQVHREKTPAAFRNLLENPFGYGLGTAGGTARRFNTGVGQHAENYYIQVAQEISVVGGVAFLVLFLGSLRRMFRSPAGLQGVSSSALAAAAGLGVAAFFLHAFDAATISLPLFTLVGLGTGMAARSRPTASAVDDSALTVARPERRLEPSGLAE